MAELLHRYFHIGIILVLVFFLAIPNNHFESIKGPPPTGCSKGGCVTGGVSAASRSASNPLRAPLAVAKIILSSISTSSSPVTARIIRIRHIRAEDWNKTEDIVHAESHVFRQDCEGGGGSPFDCPSNPASRSASNPLQAPVALANMFLLLVSISSSPVKAGTVRSLHPRPGLLEKTEDITYWENHVSPRKCGQGVGDYGSIFTCTLGAASRPVSNPLRTPVAAAKMLWTSISIAALPVAAKMDRNQETRPADWEKIEDIAYGWRRGADDAEQTTHVEAETSPRVLERQGLQHFPPDDGMKGTFDRPIHEGGDHSGGGDGTFQSATNRGYKVPLRDLFCWPFLAAKAVVVPGQQTLQTAEPAQPVEGTGQSSEGHNEENKTNTEGRTAAEGLGLGSALFDLWEATAAIFWTRQ